MSPVDPTEYLRSSLDELIGSHRSPAAAERFGCKWIAMHWDI
jgi:hypothetical protein